MKKINLCHFTKCESKYVVTLGNNVIHEFNSTRSSERFFIKTNKFLTSKLYDLNSIYSDVYSLYRLLWPHFSINDRNQKRNYFLIDNKIQKCFVQVSESLDYIHLYSHTQNANFTVFSKFNFIIESLLSICKDIQNLIKSKSINSINARYDYFVRQLCQLSHEINFYSIDSASTYNTENKLQLTTDLKQPVSG